MAWGGSRVQLGLDPRLPLLPCSAPTTHSRQDAGTAVTLLLWARPVTLDKPPGRGSCRLVGELVPGTRPATSGAAPSPRGPADCSPAPWRLETAYTARRPLAAREPQEGEEEGTTGEASWEGPWGRRGCTHLAAASATCPQSARPGERKWEAPAGSKGHSGNTRHPTSSKRPAPVCGSLLGGHCPL